MPRNPKWTRDELILALALYFHVNPLHTSENHPEIIALSALLNKLPIHANSEINEKFRNPSGVYMKLCNFLRFDPSYTGIGLQAGSKLDEEIWNEFAGDQQKLTRVANAIRENFASLTRPQTIEEEIAQAEEEFAEGRVLSRVHKIRERNSTVTKKKKKEIFSLTGKLACEACKFDFAEKYGKIGEGFAECHHNKPISELRPGDTTKLSDLAILCANCHRMIHNSSRWLSVDELKRLIER
jgi:5-methylcytosine-specific restriction protein A